MAAKKVNPKKGIEGGSGPKIQKAIEQTRPDVLRRQARMIVALDARRTGLQFRAIAESMQALPAEERTKMGITDSYDGACVYRDVKEGMRLCLEELKESAEEHAHRMLERYERMLETYMSRFEEGDTSHHSEMIELMEKIGRLIGLPGYGDGKVRVGINSQDGDDAAPPGAKGFNIEFTYSPQLGAPSTDARAAATGEVPKKP